MKPEYINRTLMPPDPPDNDTEGQIQDFLDWVKKTYKPTDLFDLYEHDREIASGFAEYLSYNYTTVRTEEEYRHKKGGIFYTSSQVWEIYCTQTKK